jgi:ketosteroid isomerase-like protein
VTWKKAALIILGVAALGALTYVILGLMTTDRERVTRVVRRLVSRLETRDAAGVCSLVTEDYRDGQLHASRMDVRADLSRWLPLFESLSVTLDDLRVEVAGNSAKAEFLAEAAARGRGSKEVFHHKTRVRLRLRKEEGEWRVAQGEYRLPDRLRDVE